MLRTLQNKNENLSLINQKDWKRIYKTSLHTEASILFHTQSLKNHQKSSAISQMKPVFLITKSHIYIFNYVLSYNCIPFITLTSPSILWTLGLYLIRLQVSWRSRMWCVGHLLHSQHWAPYLVQSTSLMINYQMRKWIVIAILCNQLHNVYLLYKERETPVFFTNASLGQSAKQTILNISVLNEWINIDDETLEIVEKVKR